MPRSRTSLCDHARIPQPLSHRFDRDGCRRHLENRLHQASYSAELSSAHLLSQKTKIPLSSGSPRIGPRLERDHSFDFRSEISRTLVDPSACSTFNVDIGSCITSDAAEFLASTFRQCDSFSRQFVPRFRQHCSFRYRSGIVLVPTRSRAFASTARPMQANSHLFSLINA